MASGIKISNCYQAQLGFYDRIPKAVLAAIAVSYATSGGDFLERAEGRVAREWGILHDQQIVPQAPPADVRDLAIREDAREQKEFDR